jgi:hypothetical protein
MNRICALLLLAVLLGLVGCTEDKRGMTTQESRAKAVPAPTEAPMAGSAYSPVAAAAAPADREASLSAARPQSTGAAGQIIQVSDQELSKGDSSYTDRKIIRNAELSLQTHDPMAAQQKIEAIAESLGGFVVDTDVKHSNSTNQSPPDTTITVSIRVPGSRFAQALESIRRLGDRVLDEKATGQDITEEYIDLEAHIRAQKALEDQFLEIMKRATKISDALEVQREISQVRGEIEKLEGRRRYLENKSSLSTIKVTLQTAPVLIAATQAGFIDNVKQAVADAVDIGAAIVIGAIRTVGVMIPITILILLPGALILRFLWRRFLVNKVPPPVAQPE